MADSGFKNNSGKIEWWDNGNLVFTISDDATGLYIVSDGAGKVYIKKISDNSIVASIYEEG